MIIKAITATGSTNGKGWVRNRSDGTYLRTPRGRKPGNSSMSENCAATR